MFARLALAALAAATTATAQVFLPDGYVHADHQNEHLEGSLFFGPGAIAQAGGPEQLSLAFGATPDAMTVTWLTSDTSAQTVVRYGTASGKLTQAATGAPGAAYSCGGYTSGAIHLVTLTGLAPATKYYYEVGPVGAASAEASFTSSPGVGPLFPYAFGVIGDLGQTANSASTVAHVIASGANSTFITGACVAHDTQDSRRAVLPRCASEWAAACVPRRARGLPRPLPARRRPLVRRQRPAALGQLPAPRAEPVFQHALYGGQRQPRE